ncbi:SET domain-containing protein-lysine N-methyltransferase [Paraburkholderia sp. NMBU_R16]|uniref:SET domain-containing protein n=1 Tax=Paraburkholderia sp. NMBU_R16 TaxID=2698676 RepID=UPI001564DFB3|nr:SET domain-containing protein-lysine N-methyltransferase [Paraburkholderia sp. NMBU_R16]NRO99613.1 SET domain-containing protein-lysine N-methyltransferase [Paraburkholderia sp. NMBU_R16]
MRRVVVRRSPVHGRGVFALRPLRAGERIFEYKGTVTTWRAAARRYAFRSEATHTFLFGLSDGRVIDGGRGGNSARWLNHACTANCETVEQNGRVYIDAAYDIDIGDELFIDYALELADDLDEEERQAYQCWCGTPSCRGTMLSRR